MNLTYHLTNHINFSVLCMLLLAPSDASKHVPGLNGMLMVEAHYNTKVLWLTPSSCMFTEGSLK